MNQYPINPANHIAPVTPNDSADLPKPGILLISGGGTLKVDTVAGDIGVALNVPAGYLLVPVKRVWSTGTAATGISVLYP